VQETRTSVTHARKCLPKPEKRSETDLTTPNSRRVLGLPLDHWLAILVVFLISFLTRVPFLHYPSVVVFDETHFGSFISAYLRGVSFFDIHPPLAKLIMTGVSRLTGYDGSFNFSNYEGQYDSNFYIWLRLTPAVFCSFSGPLMTAALLLKRTPVAFAFAGGLLFAVDIVPVIQSRFILTDGILYFFVALTFLFTSLVECHESMVLIVLQAMSASAAFCVKFTAGGLFVYIAFCHFRALYGRPLWMVTLMGRGVVISCILGGYLAGLCWTHLKLLPIAGNGDRYVSLNFRQKRIPAQICELLTAMYRHNRDLKASHPYASRWYGWPVFVGSYIGLWVNGSARIILVPNPVSLFVSTIGFGIGWLGGDCAFSIGYAVSYFPFALVKRATFVYHHEIPVMFGLMAFAVSSRKVFPVYLHDTIKQSTIGGGLLWFLILSPIVYGIPLEVFFGSLARE
jgi:dolichyl-phosphate-mannose--protein O-mannosyl transferase